MCVFHAPVTFPLGSSPLYDYRGLRKKMQKTNCDRHRSALGLPSFLILVCGNGFTRPTGYINVNSPPYSKRPSRRENLTKNLCDLPLLFREPALSEAPSRSFMGSNRRSYADCRYAC